MCLGGFHDIQMTTEPLFLEVSGSWFDKIDAETVITTVIGYKLVQMRGFSLHSQPLSISIVKCLVKLRFDVFLSFLLLSKTREKSNNFISAFETWLCEGEGLRKIFWCFGVLVFSILYFYFGRRDVQPLVCLASIRSLSLTANRPTASEVDNFRF